MWAHIREGRRRLAFEVTMFQVERMGVSRHWRLIIDPVYRENLSNIREFWISLANKQQYLSEHEFAREARS